MVTVPSAWKACYDYSVLQGHRLRSQPGYYGGTTLTILGLFTGEVNPGTAVMELVLRIARFDGMNTTYSYQHRFSFTEDSLLMERMTK